MSAERSPSPSKISSPLRRWLTREGGRLGAAVVFGVSAASLAGLELAGHASIQADAVGWAPDVRHAAEILGTVREVHVAIGDRVSPGDALVTLAAPELEAELARVDAEIRRTVREHHLQQVELGVETRDREFDRLRELAAAERRSATARAEAARRGELASALGEAREAMQGEVEARRAPALAAREAELVAFSEELQAHEAGELVRSELRALRELRGSSTWDATELQRAALDLAEAELELLQLERTHLESRIARLTLRASIAGRVASIASVGLAVTPITEVARVTQIDATQLVAYLPADTGWDAWNARPTTDVVVEAGDARCTGHVALQPGGEVESAPGQLESPLFGRAVWGLPLHVALPASCHVGVGQRVHLQLLADARP